MIDPILTLLVIPFLASGKEFNTSKFQDFIGLMENLNDYSTYMNNRNYRHNNRGYNGNNGRYRNNNFFRENSGYRNYVRNGGFNNKQKNIGNNGSELLRKIKNILNELNGDY